MGAVSRVRKRAPSRTRNALRRPGGSARMTTMTYKLILLRHGHSEWNAKNLFTGWVDVDLNDQGRAEAVRGGELLVGERHPPRRPVHLDAEAGHQHGQPGPREGRPRLDHVKRRLAAQRAPLRRAAGQGQGPDPGRVRRGAVHAVAPVLRHPAAAAGRRLRVLPGRRPALRGSRRRRPAHRVPQGRPDPHAAVLGDRDQGRT